MSASSSLGSPQRRWLSNGPPNAGPCIRAAAKRLPLFDQSLDAAMGILNSPLVRPCRRITRTCPRRLAESSALPVSRLSTAHFGSGRSTFQLPPASRRPPIAYRPEVIGADRVETVLVPRDCSDSFGPAYWRRPTAYLDPDVRSCISGVARLFGEDLKPGLKRLRQDLDTGAWQIRPTEMSLISTPSTPAFASSCGGPMTEIDVCRDAQRCRSSPDCA